MRIRNWIGLCVAAVFVLGSGSAIARMQDEDHGHGHGKDKKAWHDDDRDRHGDFYHDRDRETMRDWYSHHERHLPPGLAKRDQLPPGLERQLIVRGTLPPGLRERIRPCPPELLRELPPPPPHCEHVVIGGHVVLLNRDSWQVVDVFHFELR